MVAPKPASPASNCQSASSCCAWSWIAALVFLRLVIGWHFFSEGMKKFDYDAGSQEWQISPKFAAINEGFLNGAKGPLASFFQNQAPTTHDWRKHLPVAKEMTPRDLEKLTAWVTRYVARRQKELTAGKPTVPEFVDFVPGAAWAERIRSDWKQTAERFLALKQLSKAERAVGEAALLKQELNLADFLAENALDIQAYQHELWRVKQAKLETGATEIPFRTERLATKEAETARTPLRWVAEVKQFDTFLADDLKGVLSTEHRETTLADRVENIVADPQAKKMERNNRLVACVVTGAGLCLLAGIFTPLAALAAAGFLLLVMASQPPWVAGARAEFFYYQLAEFAALVLLAVSCAGKYAGLDGIIHRWWTKRKQQPNKS